MLSSDFLHEMYSNLDLLTFTVLTDIYTHFYLFLFIQLLHAHFLLPFSSYNSAFVVVVVLFVWTMCVCMLVTCLILLQPHRSVA